MSRRDRPASACIRRPACAPPAQARRPKIAVVVGRVDAAHEDDERSRLACTFDQCRQVPCHVLHRRDVAAAFVDQSAARAEVVLHVDHDQRGMVRIDFLAQGAERRDVGEPGGGGKIVLVGVAHDVALGDPHRCLAKLDMACACTGPI